MSNSIGVVIPTRNAGAELRQCLAPVLANRSVACCLVVDSQSSDNTAVLARELGCRVETIDAQTFNHGATRELARKIIGTDIVVFLTQDAIMVGPEAIDLLVAPLLDSRADIAYGRQLPKSGADLFESVPREFNYPPQSEIRRIGHAKSLGVFTFFCSDSFAAYRQSSLERVGGFPTILTNEDYFVTASVLQKGGAIAYVAEAQAWHSHRYTLMQEFRRFFDTGYVRGENRWLQNVVGNAEGRGVKMSSELLRRLARTQPWNLPYSVLHLFAKWLGYRVGYFGANLPAGMKERLSSQPGYWRSRATPAAALSSTR